jgi:exopolysaccharide production protein ExoY
MQGITALSILEADGPNFGQMSAVGLIHHNIAAHAWKRPTPHLSAAVERALSLRYLFLKRALDIVLSGTLLLLFLPVFLVVALLVAFTSPGSILYRQERLGKLGVPFKIIKFRSMYAKPRLAEVVAIDDVQHRNNFAAPYPLAKYAPDPRITSVGRIIRKLSLDELPQLLNVLLGDMSLVGPRPIVEAERRLYGQNFAYYDLFCPGITGLWQVSGRSDIAFDKRVLMDREYASQWSCLMDFKILTQTIPAVLTMRGAY